MYDLLNNQILDQRFVHSFLFHARTFLFLCHVHKITALKELKKVSSQKMVT